jgi:APA family basic amino acid/polyamine antiporter
VFYTMSRDGLLPPLFSKLHERYRTPHLGTLAVGITIALAASFLPIGLLADLVSLGTALAFSIVAFSVMWLRGTRPDLPRPFRVPLGGFRLGPLWVGVVPLLAVLFCILMVAPLIADIFTKAVTGNPIPAILLFGYIAIGATVYATYGVRHSRLARELAEAG